MAYSRWINSRWYTYWKIHPTGSETQGEQIFSVDCKHEFTFDELKSSVQAAVDKCCAGKNVSLEDRAELAAYMNQFLSDVVAGKIP